MRREFAMINLIEEFSKYDLPRKGVIHVGAHAGSEVSVYKQIGFEKIVLIEANPALCSILRNKFEHDASVTVLHCAVSDRNGRAKLNLTSFDQSSSLLPLKRHSEIYPTITKIAEIEVPGRTLDHLLFELSVDPSDYNFINIDIQGAELLALKGALLTLKGIDAINIEVNFEELYEGCALFEEVNGFLGSQGFCRASISTPHHPTWGDAFYVRRACVTMSSLGKNGGFGNQCFQYLYLRVLASRHNLVYQVPTWIGQEVFGLDEPAMVHPAPLVVERIQTTEHSGHALVDAKDLLDPACGFMPSMDLWGYFQLHTKHYENDKYFIRDLFKINPKYRVLLDRIRSRLVPVGKKLLGIHLRRGDYGYDIFYRSPCSWYEEWVKRRGFSPEDFVIYVSSECAVSYKERFRGFNVFIYEDLNLPENIPLKLIVDFGLLVDSDELAISNSSLSFIASMLNVRASNFWRPRFASAELVRYDPWNSEVLERIQLDAKEHERLIACD